MATIPAGILGHFTGKAGNIIGYTRNGKNFVRSRPRKSNIPASTARLAQQQKIKVCNEFTRPFCGSGFFNKTFPAYGHSGTGFNRATSAIMNLAIIGNYPDPALDYPQVLVSKGPLPPAKNPTSVADSEGNIFFGWEDNSENGTAKPDDKVILVAYFPGDKTAIFSIGTATRKDCQAMLPILHMQSQEAETWVGFLSNDEKDAADSVYSGKVMV
jgi:hypothetical protein